MKEIIPGSARKKWKMQNRNLSKSKKNPGPSTRIFLLKKSEKKLDFNWYFLAGWHSFFIANTISHSYARRYYYEGPVIGFFNRSSYNL
jgi:hypothetical protein